MNFIWIKEKVRVNEVTNYINAGSCFETTAVDPQWNGTVANSLPHVIIIVFTKLKMLKLLMPHKDVLALRVMFFFC